MLTVMSDAEIKAADERRRFLYQSAYTVDNLTAVLMDLSNGGFGMYEETARIKAHAVISWLETITGVKIPDCKQPAQPHHKEREERDEAG